MLEIEITEDILDDRLGIIESPFDRNVKHIGIGHGRHLQFLNRRDFALGMQNKNIDAFFPANAIDSGAAGVAAGRPDDIHVGMVLFKQVGKKIPQKLQRNIFKGQGWAMKEFENIQPIFRNHRGYFGMFKAGIRAFDQFLKFGGGNVADITGEDLVRQLRIS